MEPSGEHFRGRLLCRSKGSRVAFIDMRYGAAADHPIYQYCRWLALQQKADDFLREPVTLGGLPARAASHMQDFHHLIDLSKLLS